MISKSKGKKVLPSKYQSSNHSNNFIKQALSNNFSQINSYRHNHSNSFNNNNYYSSNNNNSNGNNFSKNSIKNSNNRCLCNNNNRNNLSLNCHIQIKNNNNHQILIKKACFHFPKNKRKTNFNLAQVYHHLE